MTNQNQTIGVKKIVVSWKNLALVSIALYIVLMMVFESQASSLARLASLGMYFCLGGCGLYVLLSKKLRFHWSVVALFAFGAILLISCLYTKTSAGVVSMYIYRYWTTVILLLIISNVPENQKDIKFLLSTIVIAGAALAVYLYMFYGWEYLMSMEERLDTELGNQNTSALKCAIAIILAIYNMATGEKKTRFLWWIPAIVCLPAVLFLASRKSILIIAVAVFVFFLIYGKSKSLVKRMLIIAVILAGIWCVINYVPMFSVVKERFEEMLAFLGGSASGANEGDLKRQYFIESGWNAFLESPIWGKGFYYSDYLMGVYAHNNYIELLMNNGLLGFCAYYFIHTKTLCSAWTLRKKDPKISSLAIMLFVAFLAMDIGVVSYFSRLYLLCFVLVALAVSKSRELDRSAASKAVPDPNQERKGQEA